MPKAKRRTGEAETAIAFRNTSKPTGISDLDIILVFSNKFEMYLGGENIGSYKQEKPVLGGYPFGTDFDTSLVYAPIHGSLIYLGLRFNN